MTEKINIISNIYADSLILIEGDQDLLLQNLISVRDTIETFGDFSEVIQNPTIDKHIKYEIIDEIFQKKINDNIISFIKLLIEKGRLNELNAIIQAYSDKIDQNKNIKRANIVSAIEISDDYKTQIVEKLEEKYNTKIVPSWKIDEDIIGGLIIKVNDDVIDNSIRSKLAKIEVG